MKKGDVFAQRYQIISEIGRGGMGSIYKARDLKLNEAVALKVLLPNFQQQPEVIKRFIREIKLALKITHENVVRIYDLGEFDKLYFISMEYIDGTDLKKLIETEGAFPVQKGLGIIKQICNGLAVAHQKGIVHRDIKPQNILIDSENKAKIADFGIAKITTDQSLTKGMTKQDMVIGTPEYMSPEQAMAQKIDSRTDIYSLGVVMYELFTGQIPFQADTPMNILIKHIQDPPRPPSQLIASLPQNLEFVILKTMQKKADERYQSVDKLLQDLILLTQDTTAPVVLDEVISEDVADTGDAQLLGEVVHPLTEDTKPVNVEALFQNGMSLFKERKFSQALKYFERVLTLEPQHGTAYDYMEIAGSQIAKEATVARLVSEAEMAFKENNYQVAYEKFSKASSLSADNPVVQIGLKKVLAVHNPTQTPVMGSQLAQQGGGDPQKTNGAALLEQGKSFYENKSYAEAIETFQALLAHEPNSAQGYEYLELAKAAHAARQEIEHHFLTARRLYEEGDLEAARQELTITLDYDPDYEDALKLKEKIENKVSPGKTRTPSSQTTADSEVVTERIKGAAQKDPELLKILKQAKELLADKKFDSALKLLSDEVTRSPHLSAELTPYRTRIEQEQKKHQVRELFKKGKEYYRTKKYRQAVATFQKVLDFDQNHYQAQSAVKECRMKISEARRFEETATKQKTRTQDTSSQMVGEKYLSRRSQKGPILIGVTLLVIVCAVVIVPRLPFVSSKLGQYHQEEGDVFFSQKQYSEAVKSFKKAYDRNPDSDLLEKLGEAHYYAGAYGQARPIFQQLLSEKGDLPAYHYFLGSIAEKKGDFKQARIEYQRTIKKDPRHLDTLIALGQLAAQEEDWSQASTYFQKSLTVKPNQPELRFQLAEVNLKAERYSAAATQLERLIIEAPSFKAAYIQLGRIYLKQGKINTALSTLKKHPNFSTGNAEVYYLIGECYEKISDFRKAEEYYRKCFIIDQQFNDVVKKVASMLLRLRDFDGAVFIYIKYLEDFPRDAPILLELGRLYQSRRKYPVAINWCLKAVSADDKNIEAWNLLGKLYQRNGNRKEARLAYKRSLEVDPNQPDIKRRYRALR